LGFEKERKRKEKEKGGASRNTSKGLLLPNKSSAFSQTFSRPTTFQNINTALLRSPCMRSVHAVLFQNIDCFLSYTISSLSFTLRFFLDSQLRRLGFHFSLIRFGGVKRIALAANLTNAYIKTLLPLHHSIASTLPFASSQKPQHISAD
jgi:hypothetical protein